jgi:hypothetical protein
MLLIIVVKTHHSVCRFKVYGWMNSLQVRITCGRSVLLIGKCVCIQQSFLKRNLQYAANYIEF